MSGYGDQPYGDTPYKDDSDVLPPVSHQSDLLIEQFRVDRPNFNSYLEVYWEQYALLKQQFDLLRTINNIDVMQGIELDKYGAMVGLSRTALNDDSYRSRLKFKVMLNTSEGTPNDLILAVKYFTDATSIQYSEQNYAHIKLTINSYGDDPTSLLENLKRIKPAGVELTLQINTSIVPFIFGNDGFYPPFFNEGLGFGEATFPSVGGNLTELISV